MFKNIVIIITMSFRVEQQIKDKTYVYEVTSYWDKDKKQPRQKRVLLGRKDPVTGKIIPSKSIASNSSLKAVLDYGSYYFLQTISDKVGLTEIIEQEFPDIWKEILTISMYEISERKPLYLSEQWTEYTQTIDGTKLNSQDISNILQSIGRDAGKRISFFKSWTRLRSEKEYLLYDITSISSYSKLNELLEFGYNRDGENLPQINLGMLFGQSSLLPVFYNTYPGSIKDVSTLENIIEYTKHFNAKKIRFVMDKGFYSKKNVNKMLENKAIFTVSVPFTANLAKELVDSVRGSICSVKNSIMVNDNILYGQVIAVSDEYKKKLKAFVYYNDKQFLQAKEQLLKNILTVEKLVKEGKKLSTQEEGFKKYLQIKEKGKSIQIRRNEKMIEESLKYKGYIVILSNGFSNTEEVMKLYRSKDYIEKAFDNLKNELDQKRIRVHSEVAMNGRLFTAFISLILYSWIDKRMKEKKLYKYYTVDEVISEFKKIRIVKLGSNKTLLTEVTKKQRDLFKAFGIPIPRVS
jgi:transposase